MAEQLATSLVEFFKNVFPPELTAFIISLMPILELRGGMIAARLLEIDFLKAFVICYIGNMIPIPFILLLIKKIFEILRKIKFFDDFYKKFEVKAEKNRDKIMRGKQWGLLLFVAIPLPGTGGWTGAFLASLLDIKFKKALPVIAIGVFVAGLIMSLITYGIFSL